MSTKRWTEVTDDSSHRYLIPAEKIDEWYDWLDSEDSEDGIEPDYAIRFGGGPLTFERPMIGDREIE